MLKKFKKNIEKCSTLVAFSDLWYGSNHENRNNKKVELHL